jgi:hypothetical protein
MMLFLHWAGFAVWLGAQMTFMIWGMATKKAELQAWAHTWMTLEKIQMRLVLPGAVAATVTGLVLTMRMVSQHVDLGARVAGMQVTGLLAGLLAIFVVTPLASRMGRLAQRSLEEGVRSPAAEGVRVKLAWAGTISGNLILIALGFVTIGR